MILWNRKVKLFLMCRWLKSIFNNVWGRTTVVTDTTEDIFVWKFDQLSIVAPNQSALIGSGRLELRYDGRISIHANFADPIPSPFLGQIVDIKGTTMNGTQLSTKSGHIVRNSFGNGTTVTAKALKYSILEKGLSIQSWINRKYWLKNIKCAGHGTFSLAGYQFTLGPSEGYDLTGTEQNGINAILQISSPNLTAHDVTDLVEDICALLSIAQRNVIRWVRCEITDGLGNIEQVLQEQTFDTNPTTQLIDFFSQDICNFIVTTYPAFQSQQTTFSMKLLADLYWRAHTERYVDAKFIFASVFMETVKFEWAKNSAGSQYQPRVGQSGLIKGFRSPGSNHDASFEELLVAAANNIGYSCQKGSNLQPATFTFIENRNALFHSGQPAASRLGQQNVWQHLRPELHKLFDQVDDIFLRILGFTGHIYRVSSPNKPTQFP